jgi:type IV pilus biogenesis protein CpaD/CtpE
VPTVPKNKQLRDTISTVDALAEIGVPPGKIRLLFNMVEADDEPERVFSGLFAYQAATKRCMISRDALLHVNELYSKLTGAEQNINAIVTDPTDWMKRMNLTDDMNEKIQFMRNLARQRLAAGVLDELDAAFKALLK